MNRRTVHEGQQSPQKQKKILWSEAFAQSIDLDSIVITERGISHRGRINFYDIFVTGKQRGKS